MIRMIVALGVFVLSSMVFVFFRFRPDPQEQRFHEYVLIEFASKLEEDYHKFPHRPAHPGF